MVRVPQAGLAFLLLLVIASASAQQSPRPAFSTSPSPPLANQAFDATFSVTAFAAALGIWSPPEVAGNTIMVQFDFGCGFICPGGDPTYRAFDFAMPALASGSYRVQFIYGSDTIAEFPLVVGGGLPAPVALPAWSLFAGVSLIFLMLVAALRGAAISPRRSRLRAGSLHDQ